MSLIIIGLGVFLAIKLLGDDGDKTSESSTNTKEVTKKEEVEAPIPVTNGNTIDFSGYTFTLPEGITYNSSNHTFDAGDYAFTFVDVYSNLVHI